VIRIGNWNSASHNKYLLQYHLIFVCKYRKKLLVNQNIAYDIKRLSFEICSKHNVYIKYMETDKDNIHYLIETRPNLNLSNFIRTVKSYTAYHIWKTHSGLLKKHFWKERTFWTDGYFICSAGNVSEKTLKVYIENQG
jgi:putative transposase